MSFWSGGSSATMSGPEQVSQLYKLFPMARQAANDHASYDIGLRVSSSSGSAIVTLRTTLPSGFPREAPVIRIIDRAVSHPWIDQTGRITGSDDLNRWTPASNLGYVLQSIMRHFEHSTPHVVEPSHTRSASYSSAGSGPGPSPYGQAPHRGSVSYGGGSGSGPTGGYPYGAGYPPSYQGGSGSGSSSQPGSQSQPGQSHTQLPPVPASFDGLDSKTEGVLRVMEFDEEERKRFLKETAPLDMFLKMEREAKHRAVKLASSNNEKEKQIEEKRIQLQRAFMACKAKEEEIDMLQERLRKLQDKYQPAQLSAELRDSAYALEDESEAIARDFGDGAMSTPDFLSNFTAKRTEMHILRAKATLLEVQAEEEG